MIGDELRIEEPDAEPESRQVRRARERAARRGHTVTGDRLTEAGAAERFARLHGPDLRYDHRRARYLLWKGHRWAPDSDGAVTRIALDFARDWQREAVQTVDDPDRRAAVLKAAIRLERRGGLDSMLALARDLHPIADTGERWDADPWLLGVPNGVVDLRTGQLRPGRREDGITMATAVPYAPDEECPRWERFLAEVFAEQWELVTFVQRATGYSLTGITTEQCLFVDYGNGANGKGSYANTLKHVLGDYAWNMPFATVEMRDRSAIPNDLAALAGRRLVIASETNDGARLNEARVKALTGCDPITARFLHAEFFTFEPVAKFWLSVNHRPVVRDDSHGFWRRIRLIPFTQRFPLNPALGDELRAEAPGILAWAVRGCLRWQGEGLQPPAAVAEATAQYERESDPLADFIDAALEHAPESEVAGADLYEHYCQWARDQKLGERERMTATMFGRRIGDRFASRRVNGRKVYLDVARRVGLW